MILYYIIITLYIYLEDHVLRVVVVLGLGLKPHARPHQPPVLVHVDLALYNALSMVYHGRCRNVDITPF